MWSSISLYGHAPAQSWPNRRCRRYSSTSPTIRYSSSTTVQCRSPDGNLTRKARTRHPSTPDATATDPRCLVTEPTCSATCTSPRTFVMCTIVECRQMRQCATRGDPREKEGSRSATQHEDLQAPRPRNRPDRRGSWPGPSTGMSRCAIRPSTRSLDETITSSLRAIDHVKVVDNGNIVIVDDDDFPIVRLAAQICRLNSRLSWPRWADSYGASSAFVDHLGEEI